MEAPYTIASFPSPIDKENGSVYTAAVYGIRDSKKRKRHEVVVGVDGESVNIYNVHDMLRAHNIAANSKYRSKLKD